MTAAPERHADDLWVFAYGSLMWRPGFEPAEARPARLAGFRRAFCIYSIEYRGSPRRPGLVLGLAPGGRCDGVAFRVEAGRRADILAYLRGRELSYGVYREMHVPITLDDDRHAHVLALAYVAERAHPAYAGHLPLARQAALIRAGRGINGTNLDYVINTCAHLGELAIRDPALERLLTTLGVLATRGAANAGPHRPTSLALSRAWSARRSAGTPHIPRLCCFDFRCKLGALSPLAGRGRA